jgi:hypothetical protein
LIQPPLALSVPLSRFTPQVGGGSAFYVGPLHFMKTFVASAISLLVGLAMGCYVGYRYYEKHITNEAIQQMVESLESYDALMASMSARTISLIDSGQDQKAVQILSYPIAYYYYIYASSTFTNEQRLKLRAMIDTLASTNQIVAAQIAKEMSDKKEMTTWPNQSPKSKQRSGIYSSTHSHVSASCPPLARPTASTRFVPG